MNIVKRVLKKILVKSDYGKSRYLNFLYKYDMKRYLQYSGMNNNTAEKKAAKIRLLVHPIEKALSIENTRNDFGKQKIETLIELYNEYESNSIQEDSQVLMLTKSIITQYVLFRKQHNCDVSFIPDKFIDESLLNFTGAMEVTSEEFDKLNDFEKMAAGRHSIRSFAPGTIDRQDIINAVKIAQTSPSACNRQATRVIVCDDKNKCRQIMEKHGGMSGFTNVAGIITLTGDLGLYQNEYERNTVFVDGGIFLMNMLYALQSCKIANCPIIWGAEPDNDNFIYDLLNIPESQEIISMIMIGKFPQSGAKAAKSYKRDINQILRFV